MRKKRLPLFTSKGEWSALVVYPRKRVGPVGIAIPRALFPHSTSRNRLRRQIREAIRILSKEKGSISEKSMMRQNILIRIRVNREQKPSFETIRKEMETHFKQLESLP